MVEPGYVTCPLCGSPLQKKKVFNESIHQCTQCEYKEVDTLTETILYDKILEESG